MIKNRLLYSECLRIYEVEEEFMNALEESGLIHIVDEEDNRFIEDDSLSAIEQYIRWHYELHINLEGIEALHHMLHRVHTMQDEIERLENELSFYRTL